MVDCDDVDIVRLRDVNHHVRQTAHREFASAGRGVEPTCAGKASERSEDDRMNPLQDAARRLLVALGNVGRDVLKVLKRLLAEDDVEHDQRGTPKRANNSWTSFGSAYRAGSAIRWARSALWSEDRQLSESSPTRTRISSASAYCCASFSDAAASSARRSSGLICWFMAGV